MKRIVLCALQYMILIVMGILTILQETMAGIEFIQMMGQEVFHSIKH